MGSPWEPDRCHDSYRDHVAQLIEDQREGRKTVVESEAPAMSDLLDALSRRGEAAETPPTS